MEKDVQDVKTKVFVYGSLKENFYNHHLLRTSDKLGEHQTEPEYTMYGLGGYPAIVEGGSTGITGEVYEVDDSTFARLDQLEGYPHFYNRKLISTDHGEAWVYFMNSADRLTRNMIITSGIWEQ